MSVLQTANAMLASVVMGDGGPGRPTLPPLVQRMTFGATTDEIALCLLMRPTNYIEYHLNPGAIDDTLLKKYLSHSQYASLTLSPNQAAVQYNAGTLSGGTASNALYRSMLIRAIYSKAQLYERMVEFWNDHFNIWTTGNDDPVPVLRLIDDRDVIRANALGNFGTLLRASAHSPAMLEYLNNNTNTVTALNENYARELMELHTMGVDGGYTQDDVLNVAKCFTGWTYFSSSNGNGTNAYRFRYNAGSHAGGSKLVLGTTIPSSGQAEGDQVLNILLAHPSTAKYISKKMLVRFWGYDPPQGHIDAVAAAYTSTGGDIKSMMRVVLGFVAAATPPPLKLKRPSHLLISALRAVNAQMTLPASFPGSLATPLNEAGHHPFRWESPDGYPDSVEYWVGGQLPRWNFGARLMNNNYAGVTVSEAAIAAGATTAATIADRINFVLFNKTMSATDRAEIQTYLGAGVPNATKIREAIGLALAAPSFQWY